MPDPLPSLATVNKATAENTPMAFAESDFSDGFTDLNPSAVLKPSRSRNCPATAA